MKRFTLLILCFVLTAMFMTGCGCTKQKMDEPTSAPTVLPTNEEVTKMTTVPTTLPTTVPTTENTQPSETADHGNGPLEDSGTASTDETVQGRIRQRIPDMK